MKNLLLAISFFMTTASAFAQAPVISSFSPARASIGSEVTITGSNFSPIAANNIVLFGTAKAVVTEATASQLTVQVPGGARLAPISVLNTVTHLVAYSSKPFSITFLSPGTFAADQFDLAGEIPIDIHPGGLHMADLNGDNRPEIMVSTKTAVSIYRNSVSGIPFTNKIDLPLSSQSTQIVTADVDNDGRQDILISHSYPGTPYVALYLNRTTEENFTGSAFTRIIVQQGVSVGAVAAHDMDGDGKIDLLIQNGITRMDIFRNTSVYGDPTAALFAAPVSLLTNGFGGRHIIGDVNNDSKPDIILPNNQSSKFSVFINKAMPGSLSTSSFETYKEFPMPGGAVTLAIADIDNDGKPDIIGGSSYNVYVSKNTTSAVGVMFTNNYEEFKGGPFVDVADFNGDGKVDVASVWEYNANIMILDNTATTGVISIDSFQPIELNSGRDLYYIATGDIDGDGKPDIAVVNGTRNKILLYRNSVKTDPPVISSFYPEQAAVGENVTIAGRNFDVVPENNIVHFGSVKAVVKEANSTFLTVEVPAGAAYKPIKVLNNPTHLMAQSPTPFTPTFTGPGSFSPAQYTRKPDLPVNASSTSILLADLNADGKPELIVAGKNSLAVSRNTSSSSDAIFVDKIELPCKGESYQTITADIDNDGRPDIITTNYNDNSVSVYLNRIAGNSFTTSSFIRVDVSNGTEHESCYGVAAGDLDGDGKLDLLVQNANNTVSVFRNNFVYGGNTAKLFAERVSFNAGPGSIGKPAIGDLNGDGKPELVVPRGNSNFVVFPNKATKGVITSNSFGSFLSFSIASGTQTLMIGDIDNDYKPDVIGSSDGSTSVVRNLSSGNTFTFAPSVVTTGKLEMDLADLNGDGKVDIASSYNDYEITLLKNVSTPGVINNSSLEYSYIESVGTTSRGFSVGDINSDGKQDIAVLSAPENTTVFYLYNPVALPPSINSFTPAKAATGTPITISGKNFNSVAADNVVYFGAVKGTVVYGNESELNVSAPKGASYSNISVLNLGNNRSAVSGKAFNPTFLSKYSISKSDFYQKMDLPAGIQPYGVAIADLDGDGKPDGVYTNSVSGTVSIVKNIFSASNPFAFPYPTITIKVGNGPAYVAIADINNDGKPDIMIANYASNTVSILKNNTAPGIFNSSSFAPKVDLPVGLNPACIAVADFDRDGRYDIVTANSGSNTISIIQNLALTTDLTSASFTPKVDIVSGLNPSSVALADMNGDGQTDIVATNFTGNNISVFRNIAMQMANINANSFAEKVTFATGINPIGVTCADVTDDNLLDILVANKGSNTMSVIASSAIGENITDNSFLPKVDYGTGQSPNSIGVADIDGDGYGDVVVANSGSNNVSILRNNVQTETGTFESKVDLTTGASPASAALGDIDGNGKPDILVTNKLGNSVSAIMNLSPANTSTATTVAEHDISVFPNPATNYANVKYEIPSTSDIMITVLDKTGKIVQQHNLRAQAAGVHESVIQTGSFNTGLYVITIQANGYYKTAKLIK